MKMQKFFDSAKGREVQMPRWAVAARQGLDRMDRLVSALPLSEALRRSCRIFNDCKLKTSIVCDPGNSQERFFIDGRTEKEYSFVEFLIILSALSKGAPIDAIYNKNTGDLMMLAQETVPVILREPRDDSPAAFIRSLNDAILDYRKKLFAINAQTFARTDASFLVVVGRNGRHVVSGMHREMEDDVSYGVDLCVALALLKPVSSRLSPEVSGLLADFLEYSIVPRLQEYASLFSRISRARAKHSEDVLSLLRLKFQIACPVAVEMLRMQSEIPLKSKSGKHIIESVSPTITVAPETRTSEEDAAYLKLNFPELYRMMISPTEEELAQQAFRNGIKLLIRHGVSIKFIKDCFAKGMRKPVEIEELYTESTASSRDLASGIDTRILSLKEILRLRPQVYARPPEFSRGIPTPAYISFDDFLSGIAFSDAVRKHISERGHGLTQKDVVLAICKGFDFGKGGRGAVGGAHFRGVLIRRSMRRCGIDEDNALSFLDSLGLIIHHGGSARTKDEALSIDPNPDNSIGKEIIDTIQKAFVELNRSCAGNGTSKNGNHGNGK